MAALSSVLVKFSADISDLQTKMEQVMSKVDQSGHTIQGKTSAWSKAFQRFGGVAGAALGGVATALGGLSAWKGVQFNAELEQAAISFETLLKSGDKAKEMLGQLQKLGAETPFEFRDLRDASKLLLAMGMEAEKVVPSMVKVGDAVAAIGGNGDDLQGVSRALGQMLTKGKVSAEEMVQMAERGLPVWDILAKKLGKSTAEVQKMTENGQLLANEVVPLLVEGFGERFGGAMEKQSKTFNGMLSTLTDNLNILLGKALQPVFEKLVELMPVAIEFVDRVLMGLEQSGAQGVLEAIFPKTVADTIMLLGVAIKESIGWLVANWDVIEPILVGIVTYLAVSKVMGIVKAFQVWGGVTKLLTLAQGALNVVLAMNPFVLIVAAIVAAAWFLWRNWDTVSAWVMKAWNAVRDAVAVAGEKIMAAVGSAMDFVKWIWESYLHAMLTVGTTILRAIGWLFDRVLAWVKNIVLGGVEAAKTLFINGFNAVVDWLWGLPGRVGDAIWSVVNTITRVIGGVDLWQMGRDLIFGFVNGITSLGSWVSDKLTNLISGAVESAKRFLGIHSPSRLFKKFGQYTVEGYAIGIEDRTRMAEHAAVGMASATADAAQGVIPTFSHRQAFSVEAVTANVSQGVTGSSVGGVAVQVGQLVVREEADVKRVAEQLYRLQQRGLRAKGVN